jgi:hypothetical protein
LDKLGMAAMDVSNDVERATFVTFVVPSLRPDDLDALNLLEAFQMEDVSCPFLSERSDGSPHERPLPANDVRAELSVRPGRVPLVAKGLWDVENDGVGECVVLARDSKQLLAAVRVDIGRIDDRESHILQALFYDEVHELEGVCRRL